MFCADERIHKTVATLCIASYTYLEQLNDIRASDDMFNGVVSQLSSE